MSSKVYTLSLRGCAVSLHLSVACAKGRTAGDQNRELHSSGHTSGEAQQQRFTVNLLCS